MQKVLKDSECILDEIQCYKGAGKEIREAISIPTEEFQRKAYLAVAPLVTKLKKFYEFSQELGTHFVLNKILPKFIRFALFEIKIKNLYRTSCSSNFCSVMCGKYVSDPAPGNTASFSQTIS